MLRVLLSIWLILSLPVTARAVDLVINNVLIDNLTITIDASLSATTNYYLQGVLRSASSSKYFGETKNNRGDWIDYISSPEKEFIASNFFLTDVQNASWSGQISLRFKADDPNYFGPGTYDLKIRRFTGNSTNSAGESNTLTLTLSAPLPVPSPSPTPTPTPTPSPTPSPTPTTPTLTPSPTPKPSLKPSPTPSPSPDLSPPREGSVEGEVIDLSAFAPPTLPNSPMPTSTPKSLTLRTDRVKNILLIGGGLVLLSLSCYFGYRKYSTPTKL